MEKMEIRSLASLNASSGDELRVEGLVNKTGSWSEVLGGRRKFRERILPGVFQRAIERAKNIDFLAEHNKGLLLSSTQNHSLELWEDSEGLQMRAMIAPTSYGKDIYALIKSGLKTKMSFGMQVLKESWEAGPDGVALRTIEDINITEVSTVRNPCYSQSSIEARGIEVVEDVEIPELEEDRSMENSNVIDIESLKKELKEEILQEIRALNENSVNEEVKEEIKDELEDAKEEKEDINDSEDDKEDDDKDDKEDEVEEKVEEEIEKKIEEKSADSVDSTPGDNVVAQVEQEQELEPELEPKPQEKEGHLITDEERKATMQKLVDAKNANKAKRL